MRRGREVGAHEKEEGVIGGHEKGEGVIDGHEERSGDTINVEGRGERRKAETDSVIQFNQRRNSGTKRLEFQNIFQNTL